MESEVALANSEFILLMVIIIVSLKLLIGDEE